MHETPDQAAQTHSDALCAYLRDAIDGAAGRLPFSRYVELTLYAPGLGYYSAGTAKFGRDGDFVTAPEVSPLFGATLAHGIAAALKELGDDAVLFEFGAGSGALAVSMLATLANLDALPREYWIMEVSADLRERQRTAIAALDADVAARVRWLDKLPERPVRAVIIANEVLDALPFERFRIGADGGVEGAWVEADGDGFRALWDKATPELAQEVNALRDELAPHTTLAPGYESEICPAARAFVFTLAYCLERGLIVFGDYGMSRREYYLPQRSGGTMMCHYRHRAHADPFFLPGLQDITAWVDFTAVASAGIDAGLSLCGYTTQGHFLLGSGLEQALLAAREHEPQRALQIASEVKTLTLPGEMGERFKFMALARDMETPLAGFSLRDLAAGL